MEKLGHLETQENIARMNHHGDHKEEMVEEKPCDHKEEENDKDQVDQQEEESSLPKIVPTYAPQEPREEETDDEDEGESSISTDLHSRCSMPMPPPYDPWEASESKSNDADDVFVDWTKGTPTHVASFECRRKRVAAFCERYWGISVSQASPSTVRQKVSSSNHFRAIPNRQYFGFQQRCNKRSFSHDDFAGEEYCQRNMRRGFDQKHSDSASATFHRGIHFDKDPASCFLYHKEPHGFKDSLSNCNFKKRKNVYMSSGFRSWKHNNNDSTPFESTTK